MSAPTSTPTTRPAREVQERSPTTFEASAEKFKATDRHNTDDNLYHAKATEAQVISDSEEERSSREQKANGKEKYLIIDPHIIEISSDEDEPTDSKSVPSGDQLLPGAWPHDQDTTPLIESEPEDELVKLRTPQSPVITSKGRKHRGSRRIIESSDDEDGDSGGGNHHLVGLNDPPDWHDDDTISAHFADPENRWDDDDAILTLNEPRSSRKPVRLTPSLSDPLSISRVPNTPHKNRATLLDSRRDTTSAGPLFKNIPSVSKDLPATPAHGSVSAKPKHTPRRGKAAHATIEQARRETYAQQLFADLNRVIFKDGLPKETKLNWNKRLLSTAGRARWHRSRDGVQTTEIELAEKILDCDERIRNTLSHEMCHLACWIIDAAPEEAHGRLWKAWASRVMRKRPEIEITTKHDYDITYPFQWKCERCDKIYGRFSKSIRTDSCLCGVCKEGKLIPMFPAPKNAPKTPKTSRNASVRAQDSPLSVPRDRLTHLNDNPSNNHSDYDSDSDIEILTTAMGSVTLFATNKS